MNTKKLIAGVDEVGRGSLVGSVMSSAVILNNDISIDKLNDSKKISPKLRIKIANEILQKAISVSIGIATKEEIDRINIHNATLLSMRRAIDNLSIKPDKVLIDGSYSPNIDICTETIIKGDACVEEISAASIIAKVARDNEMCYLHSKIKFYDLINNKGYGTAKHLDVISTLGKSIYHRESFMR